MPDDTILFRALSASFESEIIFICHSTIFLWVSVTCLV
jgi:hypothetical protein